MNLVAGHSNKTLCDAQPQYIIMSYKTSTTVVASIADSCRNRSTNKKSVGTDFLASTPKFVVTQTYAAKSFDKLDDIAREKLLRADLILVDTSELMSPALEDFLQLNILFFISSNIKLHIIPQVFSELYKHLNSTDEDKKNRAKKGWALIGSDAYRAFFETYPPSSIVTHVDPNLVDTARTLKFKHKKNVLILTSDKKLTSSIYNACCHEDIVNAEGSVQVLSINPSNAQLTRYHESRLVNIAEGIVIPQWHIIGMPKVEPRQERYFREKISTSFVVMDSCSLRYAVGNEKKTDFCQNLSTLKALAPGQKINVVSTSLYDPAIRSKVESLHNLFNIVEAISPAMKEEESIFQLVMDATYGKPNQNILLISNKPGRFEKLHLRRPSCHKLQNFWGCFITSKGLLCKSIQDAEAPALSA